MASGVATTVYVLTRNRPPLLRQTIVSVLEQDTPVRLVVSDNSTDDATAQMVKKEFPNVQLVRRQPPLPAHAHFNAVLAEVGTPYLVMFHDDDLMLPGYVRALEAQLAQRAELVGVACNAEQLRDGSPGTETVMGRFMQAWNLTSPMELLAHYLRKLPLGPAPFPAYMYRVEALGGLHLDPDEGGKYADVAFLCKLVERGPLRWLPDALVQYRYHSGNDSNVPDIIDAHALIQFTRSRYNVQLRDPLLQQFRFRMWHQWATYVGGNRALAQRYPWRLRVARRRAVWGLFVLALRDPQLLAASARRVLATVLSRRKRA